MKRELDQDSGNSSSHDFKDELLLALESSGKSLIEIQKIILPWGSERSEDAITVCGKQYNNSEKGVLNRIQKKIRVRELLEATLAAKEQTHALFQDIKQRLKKAAEDKKASEMRYRYLAGVARREFAITTSKRRKQSGGLLKARIIGTIHDFRPKKQRLDDDSEGDEEGFSVDEQLPKKEEILNGIKLEVPLENQLGSTGQREHLHRELKAVTIKHELPSGSETLARPVYSLRRKRDFSAENLPSPNVYSVSKTRGLQHRRALEGLLGLEVYSVSRSEENSSIDEGNPYFRQSEEMLPHKTTSLRSERGSTESWHTARSFIDTSNAQKQTSWLRQLENENMGQSICTAAQLHPGSRRASKPEPTMSKVTEPFDVTLQTYGSGCAMRDNSTLGDLCTDMAEAAPGNKYDGSFHGSDKENNKSGTSISGIDCPIFTKSSSSSDDQPEIASDTDSVGRSDSSDTSKTDIGLISLRKHGWNMVSNHSNEEYATLSRATRDEVTSQDDEEEPVRTANTRVPFTARFETPKPKKPSASDSSSSVTIWPGNSSSKSDAPRPDALTRGRGSKRRFKRRDDGPYARYPPKPIRPALDSEAEDSQGTLSSDVGDSFSPTDSLCSSGSSGSSGSSSSDSSSPGPGDCSE